MLFLLVVLHGHFMAGHGMFEDFLPTFLQDWYKLCKISCTSVTHSEDVAIES